MNINIKIVFFHILQLPTNHIRMTNQSSKNSSQTKLTLFFKPILHQMFLLSYKTKPPSCFLAKYSSQLYSHNLFFYGESRLKWINLFWTFRVWWFEVLFFWNVMWGLMKKKGTACWVWKGVQKHCENKNPNIFLFLFFSYNLSKSHISLQINLTASITAKLSFF